MLLEYYYYYNCYVLWGERGGEREVSLFLYCKNEHVNYSCDECISLSLLFFCCMFQLPMACTTTEHSVIVVGKIKYSPPNETHFFYCILGCCWPFSVRTLRIQSNFFEKKETKIPQFP